jgi:hypothetical protein
MDHSVISTAIIQTISTIPLEMRIDTTLKRIGKVVGASCIITPYSLVGVNTWGDLGGTCTNLARIRKVGIGTTR